MKIIHISDLHYGATGNRVTKLVDKIISHYAGIVQKPLIINSGDLVEDGKKSQMNSCKKLMQKLKDAGFEMLICPGNHDLKKFHSSIPIIRGLKRFDSYFRSLLPKETNFYGENDSNLRDYPLVNQFGHYFFVGLNSNERRKGPGAKGELGSVQRQELKEALDDIYEIDTEAKIIIYLHHYPFKFKLELPGPFDEDNMRLVDKKKFLKLIKNRVHGLFFGHVHKYQRFTDEESKLGINIIQCDAKATHSRNDIKFSEINLESCEIQRI